MNINHVQSLIQSLRMLSVLGLLWMTGCACTSPVTEEAVSRFQLPAISPVRSAKIDAMRYVDQELLLEFADGAVQRFEGVPEDVARKLYESPGVYGYFKTHIKPHYPRTILAKSYRNRGPTRDMVLVRTHWLRGSQELDRYQVPVN